VLFRSQAQELDVAVQSGEDTWASATKVYLGYLSPDRSVLTHIHDVPYAEQIMHIDRSVGAEGTQLHVAIK